VRYWKLGDTISNLIFDGSQCNDDQSDGDKVILRHTNQIELHQDRKGKTIGLFINDSPRIIYWKIGATECMKIPVNDINSFCLEKDVNGNPTGI